MKPLPDVRAVFFDAVGTLLHPDPAAGAVYAQVGRRHGSRLAGAEIAQRFRREFLRQEAFDQASGLRTSEARERARWRAIVGAVLDDVRDPDACFAELYHHFGRPEAWRCESGAGAVLEALATRGYVLGLASNYDHRLRSVAAGLPELCPVVPHLVISSEVGWRKPAAPFFAAAAARMGQSPEHMLLVGDDRVNDFEGARAAGWRALLFDPQGEAPAIGARVPGLTDLLEVLPAGRAVPLALVRESA